MLGPSFIEIPFTFCFSFFFSFSFSFSFSSSSPHTGSVSDVWVCGKQLLKDRKLTTIDEQVPLKPAPTCAQKEKTKNTT